jgi:hypothetical protein
MDLETKQLFERAFRIMKLLQEEVSIHQRLTRMLDERLQLQEMRELRELRGLN